MEPAYRQIAATLRARILDRSLTEGERLPGEIELARQLGVHRSTVREALRELQSSGLVARRTGSKRFVVTRPSTDHIGEGVSRALALHEARYVDVWEALTILEPPVAEAAARRRTREQLGRIEAAALKSIDGRAAEAVRQVSDFFRAIGDAARNPVLMLAQEPLLQLLEPSLVAMLDRVPQARARIAAAQRKILEALARRDADEARDWMARHVRDFRRGYEIAGIPLSTRCSSAPPPCATDILQAVPAPGAGITRGRRRA
jgi:GntR family transcriptional regulator, transcriptional repressor for pyruvate dehydrogenase complex